MLHGASGGFIPAVAGSPVCGVFGGLTAPEPRGGRYLGSGALPSFGALPGDRSSRASKVTAGPQLGGGFALHPVSRPPRFSAARANEDFFGRDRLGGFAERRSTRPGRGDDGRPSSRAFPGHEVSGRLPPRYCEGLSGASEAFSSDPS